MPYQGLEPFVVHTNKIHILPTGEELKLRRIGALNKNLTAAVLKMLETTCATLETFHSTMPTDIADPFDSICRSKFPDLNLNKVLAKRKLNLISAPGNSLR